MRVIDLHESACRVTFPTAWPWWAKALRACAQPGERGVGDTVARLVGPFGGEAFKQWRAQLGRTCGCELRQAKLNQKYPYG